MQIQRRDWLKASSLALMLGWADISKGASLMAVRVWPARDYTRVTLESDVALKTKYTFVPSPPRLAIDIEGLELNPAVKEWVGKIKPDDPNITGVRVAQNSPGVVRMVFDLKQAVQPQVFALTPVVTTSTGWYSIFIQRHPSIRLKVGLLSERNPMTP